MIELSPSDIASIVQRLEAAVDVLRAQADDAVPTDPGGLLLRLRDAERSLREARSDLERALAEKEREHDAAASEPCAATAELGSARAEPGDLGMFLQTAVRAANVGLWSWDLATEEVHYSAEWKAQLGWKEDEVGTSFEEWRSRVHPDDVAEAEARARAFLADPWPDYQNRFRMRHRDGSYRHILAQGSVEKDPSGRPFRMVGSHIDVTDLERARQGERSAAAERDAALARLRLQVERMPLGCILVTPEMTVTDWNPSAERIFGWRKEEAIGRGVTELIVPKEVRPWLAGFVREIVAGTESHVGVNENLTKDGRRIVCEWHDTPLRGEDGNVVGILAMVRDVSDRVAAEAELEASRARLARLLERLPVATLVAQEDGTIRSFNRRAVELFGPVATAARTVAAFLESILPEPEERRTMARALAGLRQSAQADTPEPALLLTVRLPHGRERVVTAECVVVDDLVVWTASDLTDVLRLEAESARLGRIVEESLDEVYVFDATTLRFRSANRSARDNVGYSLEELRERTPLDIKPELGAEAFAEKLGPLRRGAARGVRFETVHERKDGTRYPVEVHVLMSAEGSPPVFVAIIQDISVRRRAEEAIRELNAELEGRVASRTAELEEANRELESFAYSVSHDLRAPLRAMDGFAQLLVEEYGGALDAEGQRYLSRVREGAQRMGRLVDDLLRLSRVVRAELNRVEVDVSALALEILGELRASEPERRVETVVAPGLVAHADRNLLRILLENLLRNAWKFTSGREVAHIELGVEGPGVESDFFVRDDGAGFDSAYAGKLFKAFSRLHDPAEFPGTGIGLAIVDRIVRRHGGHVEATGAPGEGATFRFRLGD